MNKHIENLMRIIEYYDGSEITISCGKGKGGSFYYLIGKTPKINVLKQDKWKPIGYGGSLDCAIDVAIKFLEAGHD
jgi:hypothetical protein